MKSTDWRLVRDLRTHPVAAKLLEAADKARLFPAEPPNEVIEVLPDGTVVAGHRAFLRARRAGRKRIRVVVRDDLRDEDPALVAGIVTKDVLAGATDHVALGTAWGRFHFFCLDAERPRKGYLVTKYERRFGIGPAERLELIVRDTFGLGDDQLRRMEAVLPLPDELHDALRAGRVALKALVVLAGRPRSVVAAVAADVRAGVAPAEALARHLPSRDKRPEPRTVVRRLLRAGDEAWADLQDRTDKLGYLSNEERARVLRLKGLLDTLLELATQDEVIADMLSAMARRKTDPGTVR